MTAFVTGVKGDTRFSKLYQSYKQSNGGNEVAAAMLALADVLRQSAPAPQKNGVHTNGNGKNGVHTNGNGKHTPTPRAAKPATRGFTPPAPVKAKPTSTPQVRSDRNRADLEVLDSFLPPEETRRLANLLAASGMPLGAEVQKQELLTFVVHYVTRVRKVKCTHSHIHTVLKKLGVATPGDLGARLRDVGRRLGYINASIGHDIRLTKKGETFIDVTLPKRKAEAKVGKK